MESESGADVGQFEAAEFDPPLLVLLEPLLEGCYASSPASGMINSKISHHGLDGWVVWPEKLLKFFVDDPVRDDEGCLVTFHYQACCGEVGPEGGRPSLGLFVAVFEGPKCRRKCSCPAGQ